MKKLAILCVLMLSACQIRYDPETRLVFETTVVNVNDEPLEGIKFLVEVNGGQLWSNDTEIINDGRSDQNGRLRLLFPSPRFTNNSLTIRSLFNEDLGFEPIMISDLKERDFNDYQFIIPKLYRIKSVDGTRVTLSFSTNTLNRKVISSKITGIHCNLNTFYESNEGFITGNFFFVKKNQSIQVVYQVKNILSGGIENFSETLTIGEESVNSNIIY